MAQWNRMSQRNLLRGNLRRWNLGRVTLRRAILLRPLAASMIPGGLRDLKKGKQLTWDDVPAGGWNPHERIKVMDAEGIEIPYPQRDLHFRDGTIRVELAGQGRAGEQLEKNRADA